SMQLSSLSLINQLRSILTALQQTLPGSGLSPPQTAKYLFRSQPSFPTSFRANTVFAPLKYQGKSIFLAGFLFVFCQQPQNLGPRSGLDGLVSESESHADHSASRRNSTRL